MGGVELARPLYFWLGFLATVAGVVLHLPMYVNGADMHYRLAGMPMDLPMTIGMVLILAGLLVTAYGLVPPGAFTAKPAGDVRVRALDDARMRPAHIGLVVVLSVAVIIDAMKPITLSFVAPGMGKEYGLKSALNPAGDLPVALLPLVGLTGTVLGSLLWGWMGDKIGRKPSILFAGVLFIGTAICGVMPDFEWNLIMCGAMGLGAGGMLPITFSLLAETIPPRHKGWVMVLIGGNLAVAYLAASWLSASLVGEYSWRVLWLVGLPTGVILILLNRFIPESPRFLLAHGRDTEAHAVMARYGAAVSAGEVERVADEHRGGYSRLFRPPFTGLTVAVVILGLSIGLVTYGFQLWIPSNLQRLGLDQHTADQALRDSTLLGLPLIFVSAAMYGLWSAKKTIVVLSALVGAALVVLSFSGEALAHDRTWLYLLLAGPIVGTATIGAVLAAYSSEIYPTRVRSRGSGLSAGVGKFGGVAVTGVLVAGAAVPSIGTTALLGAVPLVLAVFAVLLFGVEPAKGSTGGPVEPSPAGAEA
ncbi:MFS transporter [Nonomuraea phyllanthi]|uniref:MFS transporter n=1 Tax=Nonomuraea phyllanthi TaxID=2219224 RepID=A0A5C4V4N7_9ACTN|nr:MFS transporter [Nonomuraea phyllanthi]KAB8186241.1 MFS transporter [Nonomuraea phyllanthi]QFY11569.1 MFS transporter [Nonomuraea phyllanthi]